ncbi:MAG TPA: DMT family transporter [Acidimicrobiales bacterium]|nr:DMT family transporter [Acidimicrobiales bacterium]
MTTTTPATRTAPIGLGLAGMTACISGVSVFVNGYGVRRWSDATAYTTAKNLIAALVLGSVLVAVAATRARPPAAATRRPRAAMLAVAVLGGSVPFVLFFEGLARASSPDAAFLHKTLVLWVPLLAVPALGERTGALHVGAIALLFSGQAVLAGGVDEIGRGSGEALILAATLLWAIETVIARRLLRGSVPAPTLAVVRMGGGVVLLLAWVALRGDIGILTGAGAGAWGWAVLTGGLLSLYVLGWYAALARAQAVDVTSVLVIGALVTAALDSGVGGVAAPTPVALVLLVAGGLLAAVAALAAPARAEAA